MRAKIKKTWKNFSWVLVLSVLVIFSLVFCQFVVSYAMYFILGTDKLQQTVWTTVYSAIVYGAGLFMVLFISRRLLKQKNTRENLGLEGLPTWLDIGLAPVGFVAYYVLAIIVMVVAALVFPNINWQQAQEIGFTNLIGQADRILAFLALVVFAPIAEELIFRGWFYGKLRERFSAWVSIIANSVIFGILHLGYNFEALQWNVAINIFCMSIILCLMREIRGTIWSGMLLHMLKNAVAFYFLFVGGLTFLG